MAMFEANDKEGMRRMAAAMGPQTIDQQIRHAVSFCWMMLPPERQNPEEVGKEVRRVLERALRDLAEDAAAFGVVPATPPGKPDEGKRRKGK